MQGWKVLAQRGKSAAISRCPGGHVHLDYGNVTLRFSEEEFGAFAAMVEEARANQNGTPPFKGWLAPSIGIGTISFFKN